MKHLNINSVCVLLACSLVAPPSYAFEPVQSESEAVPSPPSDDTDKARKRFERGVELYESGDVEAAYIEFKRAYELVPSYQLLFNIAQAQAEIKDYVGALESLSQYLKEGGSKISTERRIAVHKEIKRLKTYLAIVKLGIKVKDAQVKVDGKVVDFSLHQGEIPVSAGRRKIEVLHKDYLPWERYVDVAGEDNLELEVELVQRPKVTKTLMVAAKPSPVQKVKPEPKRPRLSPVFWSGVAATAAFGVGSAVMGGLALSEQRKHDKLLRTFPTSQPAIDDSAKKVKKLALITDIALIATGSAAVFTVVSYFWGNKKRRKKEGIKTAVSPGSLWIHGRF